jgi:hypothetical protein
MIIIPYSYKGKTYKATFSIHQVGRIISYTITFTDDEVMKGVGNSFIYIQFDKFIRRITPPNSYNTELLDHFHNEITFLVENPQFATVSSLQSQSS